MGCSTSKAVIESTDDVLRKCKIRRSYIEDAIKYRKSFALSHALYVHSIRDVGSALKNFTEGVYRDADASSKPSGTTVLVLPPPSTSSIDNLSPPHRSGEHSTTTSSPNSLSNGIPVLSPILPTEISISPPLSPMRLPISSAHSSLLSSTNHQAASPSDSLSTTPNTPSPLVNPERSHSLGTRLALKRTISPDRGSEFSPSYYSPSRDDNDESIAGFSPPSSLLADATWFKKSFTPPPIPRHLQERRQMKRVSDVDTEETKAATKVLEAEQEMPDLEELDSNNEETVCNDRQEVPGRDKFDSPIDAVPEEFQKRVMLDETLDNTASTVTNGKNTNHLEGASNVLRTPSGNFASETVTSESPPEDEVIRKKQESPIVVKEGNVNEAIQYIDDLFERVYQCGLDVSRMLEVQMCHDANSSDMKDSLKVFNSITSHWSKRTSSSIMGEEDEADRLFECGMFGSHASTLERLHAWERKLYHELKEGNLLRVSFDQKFNELHNLNATDGNQIQRDKLKATIKKLDTRLFVAVGAISATSARIQSLTNEELYPQLCEMLEGLASMWRTMSECHRTQTEIAFKLQSFVNIDVEVEITDGQKKATIRLKRELEKLQASFEGWVRSQKKYIIELDEWIKKCYEIKYPSADSERSSKRNSSQRPVKSPIFWLLKAWRECLHDLKSDSFMNGMKNFTAAINILQMDQLNELKSKRQVERSTKRLGQQTEFLNKLERKYTESKREGFGSSRLLRLPSTKSIPRERAHLDKYKNQADVEKHGYLEAAEVRKSASLDLLQQQLPVLFESFTQFAKDVQKLYENVNEKAEKGGTQEQEGTQLLLW
ncbi:hypothetical protein KP509_24G009600 [Ceratopteris richardii]|uniref:Uncharacterized protein n=1 Tax=Ceratopteris richardii TaxID=49495 RepID=A0A8T2RSJ2_CERRI|nr:hypothetical protein KP509_24G009600 [Ceratopteris richardii]KAH7299401.1 hypothetical protein KP509_24G009600 [Ceratopteris richardii]KAH7299402.1 hypothetical protein KP509_24G009600 [Ceratopteris richardii]KAH7299403.1 hypothetical protein KP509_24G009600 [Ceratopteris richardii]KAH7299404.1 hypothetical protein KP509_24G009600 [Ceratopteris richardii]